MLWAETGRKTTILVISAAEAARLEEKALLMVFENTIFL